MSNEHNAGWKAGDPFGYIREEIPGFGVPAYEGERYEALVPDTLDLQEMAALAVNGLTGPTDPLADHEVYMHVFYRCNPPMMTHDFHDLVQMKFREALPLMRIISGSSLNSEVDRRWMEATLHELGPDGLTYLPVRGRPWALLRIGVVVDVPAEVKDQLLNPMYGGRLLSAMTLYHRRDGRSLWKEEAQRLVDGLVELAVDRGSYAYYAPSAILAVKGDTEDYGKDHPIAGSSVCWVTLGLAHFYRETGYEPAIRLARKLIRYVLDVVPYYDDDGRFLPDRLPIPYPPDAAHFHAHTYGLLSMLEFARVSGDRSLLELARKGYEYGKAHGDALLGYFPELLGGKNLWHSEMCSVADMIALGLKLTEAGVGDYWDDVDRWVRNMFAEGQLTPSRAEWLKLRSAGEQALSGEPTYPTTDFAYQTTERVLERNLGAFAGWPKANDWVDPSLRVCIMHCCTGNSTRAIYYVWENILHHEDGKLRVNLLLNRASPWADVDSHIPYTGQVDVKVKRSLDLSVRIPEWVSPGEARCQVNGTDREVAWEGRYAQVGAVKAGDVATVTFPIAERTDTVWIEKERYTLVRKGNDVVAIDPQGLYCPLYQREHYRANTTRWRKVERFVSEERIYW